MCFQAKVAQSWSCLRTWHNDSSLHLNFIKKFWAWSAKEESLPHDTVIKVLVLMMLQTLNLSNARQLVLRHCCEWIKANIVQWVVCIDRNLQVSCVSLMMYVPQCMLLVRVLMLLFLRCSIYLNRIVQFHVYNSNTWTSYKSIHYSLSNKLWTCNIIDYTEL